MADESERRQEEASDEALRRLAVHGLLGHGRSNVQHLEGLGGRWLHGTVRGRLVDATGGRTTGSPALVLDSGGGEVDVHLFESDDLLDHWARLDELEGPDRRRVVTTVETAEGDLVASVYELAPNAG